MKDLKSALSATSYPGRGIVIGMHENGSQAVVLYFIMGRSANSRNRVFVTDGTGIRTEAFDPAQMSDPSLIIYPPIKNVGANLIVSNGDQTQTIYKEMVKRQAAGQEQLSFHQSVHVFDKALRRRDYEPDAPNYTPRISGILHIDEGRMQYAMNILKADTEAYSSQTGEKTAGYVRAGKKTSSQKLAGLLKKNSETDSSVPCLRFTYTYEKPLPGVGRFIHTYAGPGEVLPSFTGEPESVILSGNIDELTDTAWEALDPDNRVALFVRFVNLKGKKTHDRIVNRNK